MTSGNLDKWVKEITDKRILAHSSIEELYVDVSTPTFTISNRSMGVVDKKEFSSHRARMNYFLFIINLFLKNIDNIIHANEQSVESDRISVNTAWSPITTNTARIKELYNDFINGKIYKNSKYKNIVDFVYNVLLIFKKELDDEEKRIKSGKKEKLSTLFPEEWRNETNKDTIMTNFIVPLVKRVSYIEDIRKDKHKDPVRVFLNTVKEYMGEDKTESSKIIPISFNEKQTEKQGGSIFPSRRESSLKGSISPISSSCGCSSSKRPSISTGNRSPSFLDSLNGSSSVQSPSRSNSSFFGRFTRK